jgi:hypothetical protein
MQLNNKHHNIRSYRLTQLVIKHSLLAKETLLSILAEKHSLWTIILRKSLQCKVNIIPNMIFVKGNIWVILRRNVIYLYSIKLS